MADTMSSLPLQQLIATVDSSRLPIVLQVCSGIYFQGSVYELSGNEVCFSTGDLVKVTGLRLTAVTCEDVTSNQRSELPIDHKGLFKQVPAGKCYQSLGEMLAGRTLGPSLPFSFISRCELTQEALVVGPGTVMAAVSVEPGGSGGGGRMWCRMIGHQGGSVTVVIPLCCRGEFYECFSLQEIVSSVQLCRGHFCRLGPAGGDERPLVLCPVYDVEACMHMRKDKVRFPSSLEVDAVEVTHQQDTPFIAPLSLDELLPLPDDTFPAMAEILETPKVEHLVCSGWVEELRRHQELVLHGKGSVTMALFSSTQNTRRQYFLVSEGYGGRFRRRPRDFLSVFEVYVAATQEPGLRVTVTQPSQEAEDNRSGFIVGEELEVVGFHAGGQEVQQANPNQNVDALICRRIEELSDDEEQEEGVSTLSPPPSSVTLVLPLHWHGFFREVIANNKKYRIKDLCQQFSLPLDVKVVSRDADLSSDPLYGISSLRLEGVNVETVIQASYPNSPELCFTIPTRWLSMVIYFTENPLPWPTGESPVGHVDPVTEVTESFYLENCRVIYSRQAPPPRPPKPFKPEPLADCYPAPPSIDSFPEEGLSKPSIVCKAKPPIPLPQVPRKQSPPFPTASLKSPAPLQPAKAQGDTSENFNNSKKVSSDDEHDYESPDDMLDTIKKMHEYILY